MTENDPDATGTHDGGPRVTAEEVRDLSRLRRSSTDRHVAGVAGGLGRHLDIDPVIIRVAFVVFTFFGGGGLLLYAACWLLVPADHDDRATIDLEPRSRSVALIGVGLLAGLATVGEIAGGGGWGFFWFPLPLLVVALVAYLLLTSRDRRRQRDSWVAEPGDVAAYDGPVPPAYGAPVPPPGTPTGTYGPPVPPAPKPRDARKRGPILFWYTLGLVVVALGALGVADLAGAPVTDSAYPALALGVVASMLLVGAFYGRAGGLILVGLLTVAVLTLATVTEHWDGEQQLATPRTASAVDDEYWVGAGELVLDLSRVTDVAALDDRSIDVGAGVGRVEVVVPEGMDVSVSAEVGGPGELSVFGSRESGINVNHEGFADGGAADAPDLHIDAFVGVGEIEVTQR